MAAPKPRATLHPIDLPLMCFAWRPRVGPMTAQPCPSVDAIASAGDGGAGRFRRCGSVCWLRGQALAETDIRYVRPFSESCYRIVNDRSWPELAVERTRCAGGVCAVR